MTSKGALRLHFRRRVFDGKTKVGEREDPSNKNESPEAIESSGKTTFEFRRASADDVMRDQCSCDANKLPVVTFSNFPMSNPQDKVNTVVVILGKAEN